MSRSGFYAWRSRPESQRSKHHHTLIKEIKNIYTDRDMKSYGSPRVHRELLSRGIECSENTVAKVMHKHGLAAKTRRKYRVTTDSSHSLPLAENVLNREFEQENPDRVWLADVTYIWTQEGWLYLAVVLDAYSRKVVGWSMSHRMPASLVMDALRMALGRRRPGEGCLIHHSDRGSQYASLEYRRILGSHQITQSMSARGNCYDNATMESFFGTLKSEQIHSRIYRTLIEARADIFDYIETFYNPCRIHTSLEGCSPNEFERKNPSSPRGEEHPDPQRRVCLVTDTLLT